MPPNVTDLIGGQNKHIISTGNYELDKRIADGLPLTSLTLIEGENDTGKSDHSADYLGCNETRALHRSLHHRKHN